MDSLDKIDTWKTTYEVLRFETKLLTLHLFL